MQPLMVSQLAREQYRQMLAEAERQRPARQLRALARASQRARRADRRLRLVAERVLPLVGDLQQ
jgi:hypothetical protein